MSETIPVTLPDTVAVDVDRRLHDLRAQIKPRAATNGFLTDEDVFRAVS